MRISDRTFDRIVNTIIIISLIGVGVMVGFILYFKATLGV